MVEEQRKNVLSAAENCEIMLVGIQECKFIDNRQCWYRKFVFFGISANASVLNKNAENTEFVNLVFSTEKNTVNRKSRYFHYKMVNHEFSVLATLPNTQNTVNQK